jgi:hypothetical protein
MTQVLRREIVNVFPMLGNDAYSANGIARIDHGQTPAGLYVEVERIAVNAGSGTIYNLLAVGTGAINLRDHTTFTTDPIAISDEFSPVRFYPGENIISRFLGGTPGDIATVYAQAWIVTYLPTETDAPPVAGSVIASGLHVGTAGSTPEGEGWN